MDKIEAYNDDDSSDSVKEMEPPKKLPPPLIDLTLDDTVESEPKRVSSPNIIVTIHEDLVVPSMPPGDNPSHWTDDMIRFYNDDWGSESKFDVAKIQSKMDKDPSLWKVAPRDLLFSRNRKIRSKIKCWNCCQYGHTVQHCTEKRHILKCHMCGGAGHMERACPCSVCLTCGNQMAIFVMSCFKCIPEARSLCSRCYLFGHNFINCTDNWRRFHSTIGTTTVKIPRFSMYKPPRELWCCNCGKKGHNQINCVKTKDLTYPDTFPFVASYATHFNRDIYNAPNEEPVASTSTSTSRYGERDRSHSSDTRPADFRNTRNLSKIKKNKRNKRKKKKAKANRRGFLDTETNYY